MNEITPEMFVSIYAYTVVGVSVILAGAGIGFAVGSGFLYASSIGCITRAPERKTVVMGDTLIFTGLMGNFPFIVLAFSMWFLFSNPFIGAFQTAVTSAAESCVPTDQNSADATPCK